MASTNSNGDAASLYLSASVSLDDIQDIDSTRKGKARHDTALSDEEMAFRLYAQELERLLSCTSDVILAQSIDRAIDTDCELMQKLSLEEEATARDRDYALELSRNPSAVPPLCSPQATSLISVPVQSNVLCSSSGSQTLSSERPGGRSLEKSNDCVICADKIKGAEVCAPCGHSYDIKCLADLFRSTLTDESLFPPRCCQRPFDFIQVRPHLPCDLAAAFQKKAIEFSTTNRVYCHSPSCSVFLGAATDTALSMLCPICLAQTCGCCKEQIHGEYPCSAKTDEAVLALARQQGWNRCPGCSRMVELTHGCYHITCLCKEQFCYLCAALWKNCSCPQWDETRLIATAEERVNRRMDGARPATRVALGTDFRAQVARETERLRYDHNCDHSKWCHRPGGGRCEWCNDNLSDFLLRCLGCQMLACVRCRRNRV